MAIAWLLFALMQAVGASAPIRAQLPPGPNTPAWDKGIQPISAESYWNAVACGKQGGARPVCVFYDADLCKSEDFTLTFFTPYKAVAYEVWQAVTHKQAVPTPSYANAQRLRITVGVTPTKGSKNPVAGLTIKRDGRDIRPATQSIDDTGGRFIFDFTAFAPTGDLTIEIAGKSATRACVVEQSVLAAFR